MAAWMFSLSPAGVLLSISAAFIMLSGCLTAARQCYWCGPLAEQVHRSRRAPPCAPTAAHLTVCEPNLGHCAVIATSPPYVESRLCVKLYQDECYPLFCNSTKTWRMTCPCRGDLCNGPNTERELEAFAALGKLVAKTHSKSAKRTKRTTSSGLLKIYDQKIVNPDDEENNKLNTIEEDSNSKTNNTIPSTNITEKIATEVNEYTQITVKDDDNKDSVIVIKGELTTALNNQEIEVQISTNMIELDIKHPYPSSTDRLDAYKDDIDIQADDPKVESNKSNDEETKNDNKDDINKEESTKSIQTEPTMQTVNEDASKVTSPTTTNNKELDATSVNVKTSKEPTAEAFQHNGSPVNKKIGKPLNAPHNIMNTSERAIDFTSIAQTTSASITDNVPLISTVAPKNKTRNEASLASKDMLTFLFCIVSTMSYNNKV